MVRAYAASFGALDAGAAAALWPGVDRAELQRAFRSLRSQDMAIDSCDIRHGARRMVATCLGRLTFVPRVGSPKPRRQDLRWEFAFAAQGAGWRIDGVRAAPVR